MNRSWGTAVPGSMDEAIWLGSCFDNAPMGIAVMTEEGQLLQVNAAFCQMMGYTAQELLGLNYSELIITLDGELKPPDPDKQLGDLALNYCGKRRYKHRSGQTCWANAEVRRLTEPAEEPCLYAVYVNEVQEQKHTEEELALHSILSENSQDIIFISTGKRTCRFISSSVQHMLGYSPEELMGRTVDFLLHDMDKESFVPAATEAKPKLIHRLLHRDGRSLWFETTIQKVETSSYDEPCFVGVSRDVTDRHHVEQALRRSEQQLKQASALALLGSWEWDAEEQQLYWSDEMVSIFQVNISEAAPSLEHLVPFVHPEDRDELSRLLRDALYKGDFNCECRVLRNDGGIIDVNIQGYVSLNSEGRPVRMHGTVQDITARKTAARRLEESVDRYNSLKRYNLDAVISFDLEGLVTAMNPAAESMLGYTEEELAGCHYEELLCRPDAANRIIPMLQAAFQGKERVSLDMSLRHKQGREVHVSAAPVPIYVNHRLAGYYLIGKDMTEHKKKDELLLRSEKLSIAGQLAAGIAHEIRNPLTAVKGFIQLLGHSSQYADKYLPIMREELERIELIVSELLMLAKPQTVNMKRTALLPIIEDVVVLLEAQALLNGVELIIAEESKQVNDRIECDPNQLKQVFINFVKNAIEAMPQGGLTVLRLRKSFEGEIEATIEDQGGGISEEKLEQIGQPFFTTKESGTGLGFMVSQKMVENHGGRVEIRSEAGRGTTVTVILPVCSET